MGKRKVAPAFDVTDAVGVQSGAQKAAKQSKTSTDAFGFKNKEKVLLLSSRGITHRQDSSKCRLMLFQLALYTERLTLPTFLQVPPSNDGLSATVATLQTRFQTRHQN